MIFPNISSVEEENLLKIKKGDCKINVKSYFVQIESDDMLSHHFQISLIRSLLGTPLPSSPFLFSLLLQTVY